MSGATTSAEDVFTLQGGKEGGGGTPTGVSAVEASVGGTSHCAIDLQGYFVGPSMDS